MHVLHFHFENVNKILRQKPYIKVFGSDFVHFLRGNAVRDFSIGVSYPMPDYEKSKYDLDYDEDESFSDKYSEDKYTEDKYTEDTEDESEAPEFCGMVIGIPFDFSDTGKRGGILQTVRTAAISVGVTSLVFAVSSLVKKRGNGNG